MDKQSIDFILNLTSYLNINEVINLSQINKYYWDLRNIIFKEVCSQADYLTIGLMSELCLSNFKTDFKIDFNKNEKKRWLYLLYYSIKSKISNKFKNNVSPFFENKHLNSILNRKNLIIRNFNLSYCKKIDYSILCQPRNIKKLHRLTTLNLSYSNIKDIKDICLLKNLENLKLMDTPLTSIKGIENLSNLTSLDLLTSKLSDDDKFKENCVLKPLNKLINLTYLNLGFTNVRFVEPLQNLSKLEYLNLRYTKVEDPSSIIFNQSKYRTEIDLTHTPYIRNLNSINYRSNFVDFFME